MQNEATGITIDHCRKKIIGFTDFNIEDNMERVVKVLEEATGKIGLENRN